MNTKHKKSAVHYPRDVAKSQLTTKKTYLEYLADLKAKIEALNNEIESTREEGILNAPSLLFEERHKLQQKLDIILDKEADLRRKEFDYNCGYSFLFDGIAVLCTDYNDNIEILENNYYMVRVTPEMLEEICLGVYQHDRNIKHTFWQEFIRIAKNPKTLVMNTDEGIYQGEPIRLLVKHKDGKEGSDYSTVGRKGQEIAYLKNTTGNPIDYIQIEFFTPMFRAVVDYQKNWIPLPRNLQAILYNTLNTKPELFSFTYTSYFENSKDYTFSIDVARKYFLYVTVHNNNIGKTMYIDALHFFKQVLPGQVRGNSLQHEHLARQIMAALCYLHRSLVNDHQLDGITFNTGKVWYEKSTKQFEISVKRDKPLTLPADPPQHTEVDSDGFMKIPF